MKVILFCQNAYAFGIMAPIRDLLNTSSHEYIWYIPKKLLDVFPFKKENFTTSILDLQLFQSDVIFVPGNEVPYYLRGLKVQIFHGLAGEKKGHFHIRHYFDLYLTQGPYFTEKFNELREKYNDFDVIETGWPKLDVYGKYLNTYEIEKQDILKTYHTDKIVLYAPTFSPSLTSAPFLIKEIENLRLEDVRDNDIYVIAYESHPARSVPLNNSAKASLSRYLDEGRFESKAKNVFVTKTGRRLLARNIRSLLNRYFDKADIKDVKVNDLRNTFIVFQLKSGVPIDIVSQVVGHKRISTTEKYLELIEGKEESKGIKLKEL